LRHAKTEPQFSDIVRQIARVVPLCSVKKKLKERLVARPAVPVVATTSPRHSTSKINLNGVVLFDA
jgi:hypothetical protein